MAVTAVTGDIGAGKSTASKLLAKIMGCDCVSADVIALSLWGREDIIAQAVRRWGKSIIDASGAVIKAEIARRIFSSKSDYDFCNALLHPIVMLEMSSVHDAVLEIPLLPEVGRPEWIDTVIYVTASFEVRAERCRVRDWDAEELRRRESFLLPQKQRIGISDYVIHNDNGLPELEAQLYKLFFMSERVTPDK